MTRQATTHPTLSRRQMLMASGCGFGGLALSGLLGESQARADGPTTLAPRPPHGIPRAKRIIFLFMQGGPSQVDTFDHKPLLEQRDGEQVEFNVARTRQISAEKVFRSPWQFSPAGGRGHLVSELFPHQAEIIDDICLLQGMHTEGVAHGPATLFLHTGATNLIRPSVGSWICYGLGTENHDLPGFLTISPAASKGGPRNYSNAFLPAAYQGTPIGRSGLDVRRAQIRHLGTDRFPSLTDRRRFDLLRDLNRSQQQQQSPADAAAADAVIQSFELGYRMQNSVPGVMDLSSESAETLEMYGIGESATDDFGRQCLMARRFAEAGVRYIQVNYTEETATPRWDQHSNLPAHAEHAAATDKPAAGLVRDLKRRGLLEDTLVWWGGEFGRTPFAQNRDGRDHNPKGFTIWLCGGGVRPGIAFGKTDDFGYEAVEDRVHMHDLHATLLHLLGLDHTRLTYRFAGRDFRLTDVHGRVVHEILA